MSIRYSERLGEAGIKPSVGSTGDDYDNALAEAINDLYKAEVIHNRPPWKTKAAVELATLEWVSRFNHQRLQESNGDIPPVEVEQNGTIKNPQHRLSRLFDFNQTASTIPAGGSPGCTCMKRVLISTGESRQI